VKQRRSVLAAVADKSDFGCRPQRSRYTTTRAAGMKKPIRTASSSVPSRLPSTGPISSGRGRAPRPSGPASRNDRSTAFSAHLFIVSIAHVNEVSVNRDRASMSRVDAFATG
jgi:hypothetical protein